MAAWGAFPVNMAEGSNPEQFPATQWSLVGRAADHRQTTGRQALGELLARYLPAMRAHLVLSRRIESDQAEDLLQSFIARKFLEENLAAGADVSRGRFRTYVLTCLDRFVVSEFRQASARKRGGGQVFNAEPEDLAGFANRHQAEADVFSVAWARELLAEAVRRMEAECRASQRPEIWGVFEGRLLEPMLGSEPAMEYETLIERFGFTTPTQAANALVTAKRMFQRQLRAIVAEYAASPEHVEEEIRDLLTILARAGAAPFA